MEAKGKTEIGKVQEILMKVDPLIAMMAINRLFEVDSKEVQKIKEFISAHKSEAVQYAIAELNQELTLKEVNSLTNTLKAFDKNVVTAAASDVGLASYPAFPKGCGKAISPNTRRDEAILYAAAFRGASKAIEMNK